MSLDYLNRLELILEVITMLDKIIGVVAIKADEVTIKTYWLFTKYSFKIVLRYSSLSSSHLMNIPHFIQSLTSYSM